MLHNIIRKIYRFMLLVYNGVHSTFLVVVSFAYILLLYIFFVMFLRKKQNEGYFIGIQELCNNIRTTQDALSTCGIQNVTSVAIVNTYDKDYQYDYPINIPSWVRRYQNLLKYYIFIRTFYLLPFFLMKKQYFIFYWNRSFLPMNLDLILLKLLRKKIVIFHCGDDVRYRPIHNKLMKFEGIAYRFPDLEHPFPNIIFIQKMFYQMFAKLLDIPVFTLMDVETFLDRGAYHFRMAQKECIKLSNKIINKKPVIVHAPSDRVLKGTDIVLQAIKILKKQKIDIDFYLLENISNIDVIEHLKSADIVIDQPGIWQGRLAIEGMAHSCIVIGGYDKKYENCNWEMPTIQMSRDPFKLAISIKKAIKSLENRETFFQAYETYYSPESFVSHLLQVISGDAPLELYPHHNHKKKLLDSAENHFQRFLIGICVR